MIPISIRFGIIRASSSWYRSWKRRIDQAQEGARTVPARARKARRGGGGEPAFASPPGGVVRAPLAFRILTATAQRQPRCAATKGRRQKYG
jgi:hypothetical protein